MKHNREKSCICWIVLAILFALHCSLFVSPAGAQTFTQRLQKTVQGEGSVTLHQDRTIDALVNGVAQSTPAPQPKVQEQEKPKPEKPKEESQASSDRAQPSASEAAVVAVDSTYLKKSGKPYKITGYRVQAFAGGNSRKDRQKAEQTGNQLRMLFPSEAVYTHFYSPRWICRMGNYRTYEEAHQMLQEVRKLGFSSATIVKGKITVQY